MLECVFDRDEIQSGGVFLWVEIFMVEYVFLWCSCHFLQQLFVFILPSSRKRGSAKLGGGGGGSFDGHSAHPHQHHTDRYHWQVVGAGTSGWTGGRGRSWVCFRMRTFP